MTMADDFAMYISERYPSTEINLDAGTYRTYLEGIFIAIECVLHPTPGSRPSFPVISSGGFVYMKAHDLWYDIIRFDISLILSKGIAGSVSELSKIVDVLKYLHNATDKQFPFVFKGSLQSGIWLKACHFDDYKFITVDLLGNIFKDKNESIIHEAFRTYKGLYGDR